MTLAECFMSELRTQYQDRDRNQNKLGLSAIVHNRVDRDESWMEDFQNIARDSIPEIRGSLIQIRQQ